MPQNLKLKIAYDGTAYLGWQKVQEGLTVESMIEEAFLKVLGRLPLIQAGSRTDAGVHALDQCLNVYSEEGFGELSHLKEALNTALPKDISIRHLAEAALDFHPSLDCLGKEYCYKVWHGSPPPTQERLYCWALPHHLDIPSMQAASQALIGQHDFSAFENQSLNPRSTPPISTLHTVKISSPTQGQLEISITGERFLYKMARNLVGTLVQIGEGRIPAKDLANILASKDRSLSGMTAPAHGLLLARTFYDTAPTTGPLLYAT